jgi:hypothetical protein
MKYALLKYSTENYGDEIQSLAALGFLPRVDRYLDRDALSSVTLKEPHKMILNGWFTHNPSEWPPRNPCLDPLLISLHLSNELGSSIEKLTSPPALEFYRRFGPVGCRDFATLELLQSKKVESYFSGCLSLCLSPRTKSRGEDVYAVDVPDNVLEKIFIDHETYRRVKRVSHQKRIFNRYEIERIRRKYGNLYYLWQAGRLLDLYASAGLVVTSRLHCALPCLAFETPVIFLMTNRNDRRLSPWKEYMSSYTVEEILNGNAKVNTDNVTCDRDKIANLIKAMNAKVSSFIKGDPIVE